MSNPKHFRNRASVYRQLAVDAKDERTASELFATANLFDSMADDLALPMRAAPSPLQSQDLVILAWIGKMLPYQLAINFKL